MSESAYQQVIAEYDALEQEADAFLQEADPEGKDRGLALTRTLRKAMKPPADRDHPRRGPR
jgi:hypothetical protein